MSECFICSTVCKVNERDYGDKKAVDCPRCGIYTITGTALAIKVPENTKRYLVSHYLRKEYDAGNTAFVGTDSFEKLSALAEPPLTEKAGILLESFANDIACYTDKINVNDEKYIARIAARNYQDYYFVIGILYNQGLLNAIESQALNSDRNPYSNCTISPAGWAEVEAHRRRAETTQGFVAMWFANEMDSVWENAIRPAFNDTGFTPLRIDGKEHNNKIDDEIIAEIQRSRFLVADFTDHRGGVYFEAGYALGRGIPVIWTCREDYMKDLHFDIRQYNTIVWKNEEELKERLHQRIRATIAD